MTSSSQGRLVHRAVGPHQLVVTKDLRALGIDKDELRRIVRRGFLERVIRGMYRVPGSKTRRQDIAAAVGRHAGAHASHRSALFLHRPESSPPTKPDVTLERGRSAKSTLGRLHRSPLPDSDVTVIDSIPVTTLERTIVDCSRWLPKHELEEVLDWAIGERRVKPSELLATAARLELAPGRHGHGRLRRALAGWTDAIRPESPAEARAIRRIIDYGLELPTTQHDVFDNDGTFVARLDLAWPARKIAREYDSDRHHSGSKIELDELRFQRLESLGWSIDVLNKHDLRPSNHQWLDDLQRRLRTQRAS